MRDRPCADDMSKMGLEVISFTHQGVAKERVITKHGQTRCRAHQARCRCRPTLKPKRDTLIKRAVRAHREAAVAKAQADLGTGAGRRRSRGQAAEAQRDLEVKKAQYLESHEKSSKAGPTKA